MKTSVRYGAWTLGLLIVAAFVVFLGHGMLAGATTNKPGAAGDELFKVNGDTISIPNEAVDTAGITVRAIRTENRPLTLALSGRTGLDMERVAHVHAQFPGKVTGDTPQLGDDVKGPGNPGGATTLCTIESMDLAQAKSDYLKAAVQLKLDEDNLVRTRTLLESKVLADKFLVDAESAVVKSRADREASRQKLLVFGLTDPDIESISAQQGRERMAYQIRSPRSGVITEKGVSGGELADPTINLFTVADTSRIWVWGDVYERDRTRVKPGQAMTVVLGSHPDDPRQCSIDWVSPVLDPNTRSIRIRGSLDNADHRLLAEMYATLMITVDEGRGAMIAPASAIVRRGQDAYAFVSLDILGNESRFRRVLVEIEPLEAGPGLVEPSATAHSRPSTAVSGDQTTAGEEVRVIHGLAPGDRIVVSGALGLFNEMEQQSRQ